MKTASPRSEWASLAADTVLSAVCVKSRGHGVDLTFGRIAAPVCSTVLIKNDRQLDRALHGASEVVVIGHGWDESADEMFVWRGSLSEFRAHWDVD